MEKRAKARYNRENEKTELRYIHKYYLPPELRCRISPADIKVIMRCLHEELDTWESHIPDDLPDCVITYTDLGMEKCIDAVTARQVLAAYAAYEKDIRGEWTPEETRAAINLNVWLIEWEKQLLARLIQISEAMERQVRSGDSWLTDYEIDVTVDLYVRDDDPYSYVNMPDSWKNDVDSDSSLLCTIKYLCEDPISFEEAAKEDYYGIGDLQDHCDFRNYYDDPENQVRECYTFHELCDHLHFPQKHLARIGYISTDIVVRHQNGIEVDLTGEQTVAVKNEARLREELVLREMPEI